MASALQNRRLSDVVGRDAAIRLRKFRNDVEMHFSGRVAAVMLFGSRARGDAAQDSDYDVAVFVRDLGARRPVDHALADLAYPHILAGMHIRPVALPEAYLTTQQRGTLALSISRDGITVG